MATEYGDAGGNVVDDPQAKQNANQAKQSGLDFYSVHKDAAGTTVEQKDNKEIVVPKGGTLFIQKGNTNFVIETPGATTVRNEKDGSTYIETAPAEKKPPKDLKEAFADVASTELGSGWDQVAKRIRSAPDGNAENNHAGDPNFYRRQRFQNIIAACSPHISLPGEVNMYALNYGIAVNPTKKNIALFKDIAESFGCSVSKPGEHIQPSRDWKTIAKQDDFDDGVERTFISSQIISFDNSKKGIGFWRNGKEIMFSERCNETIQHRNNEPGPGTRPVFFTDQSGLWSTYVPAKDNQTVDQDLENHMLNWTLYARRKNNAEIYDPGQQPKTWQGSVRITEDSAIFTSADGSVREETKDGTHNYSKDEWLEKQRHLTDK